MAVIFDGETGPEVDEVIAPGVGFIDARRIRSKHQPGSPERAVRQPGRQALRVCRTTGQEWVLMPMARKWWASGGEPNSLEFTGTKASISVGVVFRDEYG